MALLLLLGMFSLGLVLSNLNASQLRRERDDATNDALKQAKEALIGRAISVALTSAGQARPGDLPCPDLDDDGVAELSCGNASGTTQQSNRLGRIPWKTLGLPDLRDGYGERLWYAVSNNFKNNTRHMPLNSDTPGTITVRDIYGNVRFDGTLPAPGAAGGVVAVIIAPGPPIQRQGSASAQDRSCVVGTNCDSRLRCTTSPASLTPKCNPANYLDIAMGEDNASFVDSSTDGFILGDIRDASSNTILNDRVAVITQAELMPLMENRVVAEVRNCLAEYANDTTRGNGRYPWAAPLNPAAPPSYADVSGARFGRFPDTPFTSTKASMGLLNADQLPGGACNINSTSGWWSLNNWKEMIFYGVADAYKPASSGPPACGSCLAVNPPGPVADKQIVVIAGGSALPGQVRSTNAQKGTIATYLEGENATPGDDIFARSISSNTFNDRISFVP